MTAVKEYLGPLRFRHVLTAIAGLTLASVPVSAIAQDTTEERMRRAEAEIRALQRAIFPGGDERFFENQASSGSGAARNAQDMLTRLEALEMRLRRLEGRTEALYTNLMASEARLAAMESSQGVSRVSEEPQRIASRSIAARSPGGAIPAGDPIAQRFASIQAIPRPETQDPGEDEYTYGFRLWDAGFYAEARQQLQGFSEDYPDHPRASFGRNLLGRAFLDDGLHDDAARWFAANYLADKSGPRAPDSLLFLAEALIKQGETRRACIALAEFAEVYRSAATGRLAEQYFATLRKVTCS